MRKFYYILILSLALLALMPQPAQASVTFTALLHRGHNGRYSNGDRQVSSGSSTGISIQITDTNGSQLYSGNTSHGRRKLHLTCSLGIMSRILSGQGTADTVICRFLPSWFPTKHQPQTRIKEDPNRLMPVVVLCRRLQP